MLWAYIIFIVVAIVSFIIQNSLQNKFKKYSNLSIPNGMTGKDVAEKMLHDSWYL